MQYLHPTALFLPPTEEWKACVVFILSNPIYLKATRNNSKKGKSSNTAVFTLNVRLPALTSVVNRKWFAKKANSYIKNLQETSGIVYI